MLELIFGETDKAIEVMREVARWGREKGYRVWPDKEYWHLASKQEAVYLHKFCVRREFAHQKMTEQVISALKEYCKDKGISYIRLDAASDEAAVKKIYLDTGFQIVKTLNCNNGRSMDLYELRV